MKRSLRWKCVRRPDPKFCWSYIISRFHDSYVHKSLQKIRNIVRCGVPQSDWVNGRALSTPFVPTDPPQGV